MCDPFWGEAVAHVIPCVTDRAAIRDSVGASALPGTARTGWHRQRRAWPLQQQGLAFPDGAGTDARQACKL